MTQFKILVQYVCVGSLMSVLTFYNALQIPSICIIIELPFLQFVNRRIVTLLFFNITSGLNKLFKLSNIMTGNQDKSVANFHNIVISHIVFINDSFTQIGSVCRTQPIIGNQVRSQHVLGFFWRVVDAVATWP